MGNWKIKYTKQAQKDLQKIISSNLKEAAHELVNRIKNNPFANPPAYEKLSGELKGYYSRRINIQHRLIYQVFKEERIIKIIRMWTHYE